MGAATRQRKGSVTTGVIIGRMLAFGPVPSRRLGASLGMTAVAEFLVRLNPATAYLLERLQAEGVVRPVEYRGQRFWVRTLHR